MEQASRSVSLPEEMYKQLETRVQESEFSTVDEYVKYVVQKVLEKTSGNKPQETQQPAEDEAAVRKRLQDLGYLG